jgi:hypothetical protein
MSNLKNVEDRNSDVERLLTIESFYQLYRHSFLENEGNLRLTERGIKELGNLKGMVDPKIKDIAKKIAPNREPMTESIAFEECVSQISSYYHKDSEFHNYFLEISGRLGIITTYSALAIYLMSQIESRKIFKINRTFDVKYLQKFD